MTTGHWASHVTIVCEDISQIAKLSQAPAPAPAERADLALFSYNPSTLTHPPGKVYFGHSLH